MNTYCITLPWPPSNNRYYRHNRGRTHISAEGQAYRDNVARIIKNAMLDIGLAIPVKISIECHMPDRRRRDLDNLQKAAFDALKWFTEFGHLNRGDMLTSEQHRCHNEKKKFQRRV